MIAPGPRISYRQEEIASSAAMPITPISIAASELSDSCERVLGVASMPKAVVSARWPTRSRRAVSLLSRRGIGLAPPVYPAAKAIGERLLPTCDNPTGVKRSRYKYFSKVDH